MMKYFTIDNTELLDELRNLTSLYCIFIEIFRNLNKFSLKKEHIYIDQTYMLNDKRICML